MTIDDFVKILTPIGSGLLGGLLVAILNHLFTRRKTYAETKKLEAEAEKVRAETQKLLVEMQHLASTVQEVSDRLGDANEKVIYDGRTHCDGADFSGGGERFYGDSHDKPKGAGLFKVEDGVLNIQRSNTGGRYRVTLLKYFYAGVSRDYIPKNDLIAGKRLLKLTCEAKAAGGSHTGLFIVKRVQDGEWMAKHEQTFSQNEWTPVETYFRISPNEDCFLVIDDQQVSKAKTSLQLRRLFLAERDS